jgi:transposase
VVDHDGLPIRIVLTAGQVHDQTAVPALLSDLAPGDDVVADRGYDSNAVLNFISQAGARPHIPSLSRRLVRRSIDPETYRQRNLVERFFNKLKHFRAVATRYEKHAANYLALVKLAATRIWMRAYESVS